MEVATEQILTARGYLAVNSLRGSGLGYITGTSVNPSKCLTRPLSWVRDEAVGPAGPFALAVTRTWALCGVDVPSRPALCPVFPPSPPSRCLQSHFGAALEAICPDTHPLLGSPKANRRRLCRDRESGQKRDRGRWRRVEGKTCVAHYFGALSGVSCG